MPPAAGPDEAEEAEREEQQQQTKGGPALEGLVVGSYCHDALLRGGRVVGETLGGAAAFVSNVLDAASPEEASFLVVSKVRPDFAYASAPAPARHPPLLCPTPTTSFHARFSDAVASAHAPDRQLRRFQACDPIYPDDLPDRRFAYVLAVGVAGEVLPETLERMIRLCRAVLVDAQALIRAFDAVDGGSEKGEEGKGRGTWREGALAAFVAAAVGGECRGEMGQGNESGTNGVEEEELEEMVGVEIQLGHAL